MNALELRGICLTIESEEADVTLLKEVSLRFRAGGQLVAVLGPSGCGKSTLMKVIAGISEATAGEILWQGRRLGEDGDFEPEEVGYVPQFSIAHEKLEVWECIEDAVRLRCEGLEAEGIDARVDAILAEVGMEGIAEKRVEVLSGGQRRRLALGMELASSPRLLLCDEVTSGLDPRSEDEVTDLLKQVSRKGRLVFNITHSLRHLSSHDSVVVLFHGHVAYHGTPSGLTHYFGIEHQEGLYPRLLERSPEEWASSWSKHGEAYEKKAHKALEAASAEDGIREGVSGAGGVAGEVAQSEAGGTGSFGMQVSVLMARRWKLFWRDRGQVKLQLAMIFGFPCLVVVFALKGLPALRAAAELPEDPLKQLLSDFSTKLEYLRVGGMVSGLVMFQVVLLALMGSNNAAREISAERLIYEKERFSGLSAEAYVVSKILFQAWLVGVQSVWMSLFVHAIVGIPGSLMWQTAVLFLVNAAMTSVALGISAVTATAEQSSLVSVYLVGFQLPLSGAVLALPQWLGGFTRPLISSYWGWSGFLQTLSETRFYNAVVQMTQTPLMPLNVVVWALMCHVLFGIFLAYIGCKGARWES
jgi:ABC-type multidrug transport system ATPase subunit